MVLYSVGTNSIFWRLELPFVFSSGGFGIDDVFVFIYRWLGVLFVVGELFGLYM